MGNANILWNNFDVEQGVNLIAGFLVYNTNRKELSIEPERLAANRSFYGPINAWLRSPETEGLFEPDLVQQWVNVESQRGAIGPTHSDYKSCISTLIVSIVDNDPANFLDGKKAGLRIDCLATPLQIEAFTVPVEQVNFGEVNLVPTDVNNREYVKTMERRAFIFAAMLRAVAGRFTAVNPK